MWVQRVTKVHLVNKDLVDMMALMVKMVYQGRLVLPDDKDVMEPKVKLVNQGHRDRLVFVGHPDLRDALAPKVSLDVSIWTYQSSWDDPEKLDNKV